MTLDRLRGLTALLRRRPALAWWSAAVVTVVAVVLVAATVDVAALERAVGSAFRSPLSLLVVVVVYASAFVLRAIAWTRVLPALGLGQAVAALHVSLGGNHVLPFRLGEVLRVTSVVRRTDVGIGPATASTVTLRAADLVAVVGLALVLGPTVIADVAGGWFPVLVAGSVGLLALGVWWSRRDGVPLPGPIALAVVVVSWALEAVVIHQAAAWAGVPISVTDAIVVTCVTIAAQAVAVAPGGLGTYEAAATAALVATGVDAGTGLAIAVTAHAVKLLYGIVAGAIGAVVPAPSLVGHLRLPRAIARRAPAAVPPGPVVLFLPAHDEEATVGPVVGRIPAEVAGRPVVPLVIDDGSTDRTAARAAAAGAEVVRLGENRGLGAAVRRGLQEALARGAAVIAFADADGEYRPEELARLVTPILAGEADYVVGSRFAGTIERMLPHRRLGNRVLTSWVRWMTRLPVTDGQSGYRALSATAAREAVIEHDFNYAQVLTLDLVGRGLRYREVPIGYAFRETGTSFVRLGRYLRAVVPAVWRVLNRTPGPSVLDDVLAEPGPGGGPRRGVELAVGTERVNG